MPEHGGQHFWSDSISMSLLTIFSPPKCSTEKRLRNILCDPENWHSITLAQFSSLWRFIAGIITLQISNCSQLKKSDYLGCIPQVSEIHLIVVMTMSLAKFDDYFLRRTTKISNKFGKYCPGVLKWFKTSMIKFFFKTFFNFFPISYVRFLINK